MWLHVDHVQASGKAIKAMMQARGVLRAQMAELGKSLAALAQNSRRLPFWNRGGKDLFAYCLSAGVWRFLIIPERVTGLIPVNTGALANAALLTAQGCISIILPSAL